MRVIDHNDGNHHHYSHCDIEHQNDLNGIISLVCLCIPQQKKSTMKITWHSYDYINPPRNPNDTIRAHLNGIMYMVRPCMQPGKSFATFSSNSAGLIQFPSFPFQYWNMNSWQWCWKVFNCPCHQLYQTPPGLYQHKEWSLFLYRSREMFCPQCEPHPSGRSEPKSSCCTWLLSSLSL